MHEEDEDAARNPLEKRVPGHLFQFKERIFGMTLPQLLSDIGAGIGIVSLCSSWPLVARIVASVLLAALALVLIHGKVGEQTLLAWLFLYVRSRFVPKHTTWQSLDEVAQKRKKDRRAGPSIQTTWMALDSLQGGIAGYSEPGKRGAAGRYWAVLECEGPNLHLLPQAEQVRTFGRYERLLCGLSFRLQFLSQVQQVDPASYPPLLLQKQALAALWGTPRLAALQEASIRFQEQHMAHCTITRHFMVVSATAAEEAARGSEGLRQGALSVLWRLLFRSKPVEIPRSLVLDQLRTRLSVLTKRLQQLDVRCTLLNDAELLKQFAGFVVPGVQVPSFIPQVMQEAQDGAIMRPGEQASPARPTPPVGHPHPGNREGRRVYSKRIEGLHAAISYTSQSAQARIETDALRLSDLVSPSRIEIAPDVIEVEVGGKSGFSRSFFVTGYGSS